MKRLSGKNSQNRTLFVYGIIFVLLFALCWLFPYSGDDWAWGSQIGLDRLDNWFDNYSGRYFGNLIVLALTRSNLLKAFTMSFCLTGIIVLVNKLTGEQKNGVFIISTVLVFMPITILRQAIVWTAGFANYTTSIFLTLIYIYYVNNIYGEKKPKNSFIAVIPLAILGFANTLIVEHLTIYNVILSIYVIIFTLIKFKKVYIQNIAYFVGTIAGTLLMFSNSVYRSVADGSDSYRTIGGEGGIITRALDAYFGTVVEEGFFNNFILNIFLVGTCLVIWFMVKNKLSKKAKLFGSISIAVMIAFAASTLMLRVGSLTELMLLRGAEGAATGVYILAFIVFLFVLPFEINQKMRLFFILGSTGCMIAPLLVVTPIGSRCFFAPYVMMLYLGMEFYSLFDEDIKKRCEKLSRATIITALVGLIYLFYIYGTISICSNERIEKAQADAQNGAEIIQVEELPYKKYVWCSDVDKKILAKRFKLFYDI
ncbi:MAG: hypothetical protein J1E36_08755, partial [Eubacterium sp.]|nr:hypothetical protein [Eubacterium sp.]